MGALRADKRGIQAVGAPMGGGVEAAEAAELEFFVGGAQSARERVTPILEELARIDGARVAGDDIGHGYAAKLLINLLWFGQVAAVSEAVLLAERLGVSAGSMRQLIAGSAADSAFAHATWTAFSQATTWRHSDYASAWMSLTYSALGQLLSGCLSSLSR